MPKEEASIVEKPKEPRADYVLNDGEHGALVAIYQGIVNAKAAFYDAKQEEERAQTVVQEAKDKLTALHKQLQDSVNFIATAQHVPPAKLSADLRRLIVEKK